MQINKTVPQQSEFPEQSAARPHIMVIEAPFYKDIAAEMAAGAFAVISQAEASYERFEVPGALEIPAAILYGIKMKHYHPARRRFDGYVALGCLIKGDTHHFDIVAGESARGIMDITTHYTIAVGNGIITAYSLEQARARAIVSGYNIGGRAANAALSMIALKNKLGLYPREV